MKELIKLGQETRKAHLEAVKVEEALRETLNRIDDIINKMFEDCAEKLIKESGATTQDEFRAYLERIYS